jgi:hypothetical protein
MAMPITGAGRYSQLAPCAPNCPQAPWDFHCHLRPRPCHVLAAVSFIHPHASLFIHSAAGTLVMLLLFETPTSAGTASPTITARELHSARARLKHSGGSVLARCISSAKQPTPPSPSRGTSMLPVSRMCATSCLWCSAVARLACLPLQQASTPHSWVPAGSGARRKPPRKFCTRHVGASASFVCVGHHHSAGCAPVSLRVCWVIF